MTDENQKTPRAARLTSYTILAALVAFGTLYFVLNGGLLIPLFAVLMVYSFFNDFRFDNRSLLRWLVRLFYIAVIYLVNQGGQPNTDYMVGTPFLRAFIGQVYLAETVHQAWLHRDEPAQVNARVLFFSGMAFVTACNTFEENIIPLVTPVYIWLVVRALRTLRDRKPMAVMAERRTNTNWRRLLPSIMYGTALVFTLLLGLAGQLTIRQYKHAINEWGGRLLGERGWLEGTGMSSQPQLGSTFGLDGSPARVLRIENMGTDDHWRGVSFNSYHLGVWGPALHQRRPQRTTPDQLDQPRPHDGQKVAGGQSLVTATRLVADNPLVYLPLGSVGLDIGEADAVEYAPTFGGPLRLRQRPPFTYLVTVGENIDYQGPFATPFPLEKGDRLSYLQVPDGPDYAGVRALAKAAASTATKASDKAFNIASFLQARNKYSLSTQVGRRDPIVSFLMEKKAAHCEFFATAAVLMLRYNGVPARYVVGYLAHERNSEGAVIVRQRDAHAWTEYWDDDLHGWRYVDATPADGRPNYHPESIPAWRRAMEWLQDTTQKAQNALANLPPFVLNLIIATIAALPLIIMGLRSYLKNRGKRVIAEKIFIYAGPEPDLATLANRFETALAKAEAPIPSNLLWQEHLTALSRTTEPPLTPEQIEAAREFARRYDTARFGGQLETATVRRLQELLTLLEKKKNG